MLVEGFTTQIQRKHRFSYTQFIIQDVVKNLFCISLKRFFVNSLSLSQGSRMKYLPFFDVENNIISLNRNPYPTIGQVTLVFALHLRCHNRTFKVWLLFISQSFSKTFYLFSDCSTALQIKLISYDWCPNLPTKIGHYLKWFNMV